MPGLKLIAWTPWRAGLPDPVLGDDSEMFPPETVKAARLWLRSMLPEASALYLASGPTAQLVTKAACTYDGVAWFGVEQQRFQAGTAEVLLPIAPGMPVNNGAHNARFEYLVARTFEGLTILGPRIDVIQTRRI